MAAILPFLGKIIKGIGTVAAKIGKHLISVLGLLDEPDIVQDEIASQKGFSPEKSQADDIQKLNEMLVEYRSNISKAADDLEREMIVEYSEELNEIMAVFEEYNKTLKVARTESIQRRFNRLNKDLRGTFEKYISRRISFDDPELTGILKLPAGELKSQRLQEFKKKVFIEATNDIIARIRDAVDDFSETVEDTFAEHLDRAEQAVEEKKEAFEKLTSGSDGDTNAAENVYIKADYLIAVCSYAEALI